MELSDRYARLSQDPNAWIGVDFDGTVAVYDGWVGLLEFGEPIPLMVNRIKFWIENNITVKIFTARYKMAEQYCSIHECWITPEQFEIAMGDWTEKHIGVRLETTCIKDLHMIELWDDRAIQVIPNTGKTLSEEHEAQLEALKGAP